MVTMHGQRGECYIWHQSATFMLMPFVVHGSVDITQEKDNGELMGRPTQSDWNFL